MGRPGSGLGSGTLRFARESGIDTLSPVSYSGETRLTWFLGLGIALLEEVLGTLHGSPRR